jgi:hypothetical protein
MLYHIILIVLVGILAVGSAFAETEAPWNERVQLVLDETQPLEHARGNRLPLYLWPARNPGALSAPQAEDLLRQLDARGVGLVTSWYPGKEEENLAEALPIARAQKKLGLRVNIDATSCTYSFFDGSEETAHIDADGKPFFDDTFGKKDMGCPFRLEHRVAPMREKIQPFVDAYAQAGLEPGFVFADWEIDGPLEWNDAYSASKRCTVCRENLPQLDDFLAYQQALRDIRSRITKAAYADPLLETFPQALVGNYALYPGDGWRYWYDYFEKFVGGQPALKEQNALYRHWSNDFESSGYTFAMPVVYPWSWCWNWYDFEPGDFRWFYNAMRVASNAGQYTPSDIPIIAFVHWNTVDVGLTERASGPLPGAEKAEQMSEECYREILWHMLLRGTDTFFLWCTQAENQKEVQLLHPVWAAAQEYGAFLEQGAPISFAVRKTPGPFVSGLRLGSKVLVRRTDFTDDQAPVIITVDGKQLEVPRAEGQCQILSLD